MLVPFGRYKGQPVDALVSDAGYLSSVMTIIEQCYPELHQEISPGEDNEVVQEVLEMKAVEIEPGQTANRSVGALAVPLKERSERFLSMVLAETDHLIIHPIGLKKIARQIGYEFDDADVTASIADILREMGRFPPKGYQVKLYERDGKLDSGFWEFWRLSDG